VTTHTGSALYIPSDSQIQRITYDSQQTEMCHTCRN